jgi:hypothetical protein
MFHYIYVIRKLLLLRVVFTTAVLHLIYDMGVVTQNQKYGSLQDKKTS